MNEEQAEMALVIMAAGLGRRFGGLKQLEAVGPAGEALIEYALFDALEAGFSRVVFVIKEEMEPTFRRRFGTLPAGRCEVAYAHQRLDRLPSGFRVPPDRKKPWGTGHAVLSAKDAVHGPFAVINADDFYGRGAFTLLGRFLSGEHEDGAAANGVLVGYGLAQTLPEQATVSRAVCRVDEDEGLVEIVEREQIRRHGDSLAYLEPGGRWRAVAPETLVSLNTWGFRSGFFAELERAFAEFLEQRAADLVSAEFQLPGVVNDMLQAGRGRIQVSATDERWFGITHPEDLAAAREAIAELIAREIYPCPLWESNSGYRQRGAM